MLQVMLMRYSIGERVNWEKLLLEFYRYCFNEIYK